METTNLVIIGSGPAAYTAAIYAARAELFPILFEGFKSGPVGGQLMTTTMVENFPGFPEGIMGPDLMLNMKKQVLKYKTKIISEDVEDIDFSTHPYVVISKKEKIETRAIIIATGCISKRLDIKGSRDTEFWQKGVSTCAICDGAIPIFRDKDIFVIGGGDSAMEEAIFLTKFAKKVYIVHRRDALRASKIMAKRAADNPKIDILFNSEIIEILGDEIVKEVVIINNKTKKKYNMPAGGVFFAIGHAPNTDFLKNKLELTDKGYILVKKGSSLTNIEGVFAGGDVQDPIYKQAVTAAGSGCMAFLDAQKWLSEKGYV